MITGILLPAASYVSGPVGFISREMVNAPVPLGRVFMSNDSVFWHH